MRRNKNHSVSEFRGDSFFLSLFFSLCVFSLLVIREGASAWEAPQLIQWLMFSCMLWFMETWLRGWLSVKDADTGVYTHTHTHSHCADPNTQRHGRLHDLVTDKCSRITGSQCNQIISNRLSGLWMFFFPPTAEASRWLPAVTRRMPPFWSSDNKTKERYHISHPG